MALAIKELVLYSYMYSSASWRVRAVLAYKKIPFTYECVQLLNGEQHSSEFVSLNPMHQVPVLKVVLEDGVSQLISQSLVIIQFLEDNYPQPSVYPAKDQFANYKSRAIAETISGGIQPLQNLETLTKYVEPLGSSPLDVDQRKTVARFWLQRKLGCLEKMVKPNAGKYCVGDELSVADFALVPQMFNARRFELDTKQFPTIHEIDLRLQDLEIFMVSHPLRCPEAPSTTG